MLIPFGTETLTVIRAGTTQERGNNILDWSNTTGHDIDGCSVQPMATEEVKFTGSNTTEGGTARTGVVTRWKVYAPPGSDVGPLDRAVYRGVVYDVEGQVAEWPSPGGLDHVAFELRRMEG